jgi:hypothetical protein
MRSQTREVRPHRTLQLANAERKPHLRRYSDQQRGRKGACLLETSLTLLTLIDSIRLPARPYQAPAGFQPLLVEHSELESNVLRSLGDLDGKQVWQIAAPASIDLKQIKKLDLAAALRGEAILSADGICYGLQTSSEQDEILLLPQGNPVIYRQAGAKIARSFRLRQVAGSADQSSPRKSSSTEELVFTARSAPPKKPVREQPEKLKYRYTPFGVDSKPQHSGSSTALADSILLNAASQDQSQPSSESPRKKKKKTRA